MSSAKVPLTFTFRRHGAHPPLFVAGSFSDPPWQPLEMDASIDQHGDVIFTKQVMVDESSEVQYKFRHASGDWWALDPDAETVTDKLGNVNSLLLSPSKYAAQETTMIKETHCSKNQTTADHDISDVLKAAEGAPDDLSTGIDIAKKDSTERAIERDEARHLPFTPIDEVANTTAEIANSASQLGDDDAEVDGSDALPMFSHECFASISDSPTPGHHEARLRQDNIDYCLENHDHLNTDYDNPRLEHFPSDRDSIMAAMRRLSTTVDADATMVDTLPLSPITTAKSSCSNGLSPPSSLNLEETNTAHKQVGDMSLHDTRIRTREHSLQSITESEEAPDRTETLSSVEKLNAPTEYIGPVVNSDLLATSGGGSEDEGIDMGSVSPKCKSLAIRLEEPNGDVHHSVTIDKCKTDDEQPIEEHAKLIKSTTKATRLNDEQSSLQKPTDSDRPHSPSTYFILDDKKDYWLLPFVHTIIVNWLGGFVYWLYNRSRNQVMYLQSIFGTGTIIVLGAGISLWALQDRLPSIGLSTSLGMRG